MDNNKFIADYISEVKRLSEAATKGPWNILKEDDKFFTPSAIWSPHKSAWDSQDEPYNIVCEFPRECEYGHGADSHIESDAEFIKHARTSAPRLAEALEYLMEELNDLHKVHDSSLKWMVEEVRDRIARILSGDRG